MSFRRYKNQVWVVDQNIKDTKTVPGWQKSLEKYLPNKRIEGLGLLVHILDVQITCSIFSKGHLACPGLTLPSLGICLLLIFKIAATVLLEHDPSSPPTLALGSTRPTWLEHMAAVQLNRVRDLSAKTEGMISFFPGPWGSKPTDCTYKIYSQKKKKKRSTHNFPSPKTEVCKIQTKRSHLSKRFLIPPPKHPPAHATFAVRNQSCSETVLSGQTQVVGDMADDRLRLILTVLSLDLRNTLVFTTKVTMVSKPRLAKFLWSRDQFIIFLFITSVPLFWELSVVRESPLKTMTIYGKKKKEATNTSSQ